MVKKIRVISWELICFFVILQSFKMVSQEYYIQDFLQPVSHKLVFPHTAIKWTVKDENIIFVVIAEGKHCC